jgi:hypothetical protein
MTINSSAAAASSSHLRCLHNSEYSPTRPHSIVEEEEEEG